MHPPLVPEGGNAFPPELPSAKPIQINKRVWLQPPLSRRGHGPGLVVIQLRLVHYPLLPSGRHILGTTQNKNLDPLPRQKWAEEGFAVADVEVGIQELLELTGDIRMAISALEHHPQCEYDGKSKVGFVIYHLGSTDPLSGRKAQSLIEQVLVSLGKHRAAVVLYDTHSGSPLIEAPQCVHVTPKPRSTEDLEKLEEDSKAEAIKVLERRSEEDNDYHVYIYDGKSPFFVLPWHLDYSPSAATVAHTRSLGFLKKHLGGPNFDLETIWDEHTLFEFGERDVEKTMGTMVQEPYVNHIPTVCIRSN